MPAASDDFFRLSLAFFWITGFASATPPDGVFMTTVNLRDQALTRACRACWNMGAVIGSGLFVSLTGWLHNAHGLPWVQCWVIVVCMAAASMALFGVWHVRVLPPGGPSTLKGEGHGGDGRR